MTDADLGLIRPTSTRRPSGPPRPRHEHIADARRSFANVERELDAELDPSDGEVPRELHGTLLRNGPGGMALGSEGLQHPFDGDGMVVRFAFENGRVHYTNRFVQTAERLQEQRAERPLFRGFGSNLPGGILRNALRLRFKNTANTSLVVHAGKLLALWEGGVPHALDIHTLRTLGRHDFDGALRNRGASAAFAPELPFSAHPRLDHETGELWNFGTLMGLRPRLLIYGVSAAGALRVERDIVLPRLHFIHDFALTRHYFVFHVAPVAFQMWKALSGVVPPADAIRGEEAPGAFLLVPRDGGPPRRFATSPGFCFHLANAYEDSRGQIVVDAMRAARFPDLKALFDPNAAPDASAASRLTRYVIDPRTDAVLESTLAPSVAELPTIHPKLNGRRHRFVYGIASKLERPAPIYDSVMKVDCDNGSTRVCTFRDDIPSEPIFVPRPGSHEEDDGHLLTVVYRPRQHRSDLVLLDARALAPVATLPLPHHVPPLFHGIWTAR